MHLLLWPLSLWLCQLLGCLCKITATNRVRSSSDSSFAALEIQCNNPMAMSLDSVSLGFILLMTLRSVRGSTVHVTVNRSGANGTDIVSDRLPYGLPVAY